MPLERELATFRANLAWLISEHGEGKSALIHGDDVAGVYPTRGEALQAGYDQFGIDSFMIKQIQESEKPMVISRGVRTCPS